MSSSSDISFSDLSIRTLLDGEFVLSYETDRDNFLNSLNAKFAIK